MAQGLALVEQEVERNKHFMTKQRVLVVEDNEDARLIVGHALGTAYDLTFAMTAEEAQEQLQAATFSLILLDLSLPQQDGYSIMADLERHTLNRDVPVMCISSRSKLSDKVLAFNLGAEDYITKPFDMIELRARVDAKLKKLQKRSAESNNFRIGDLDFNLTKMQLALPGESGAQTLDLTSLEFKVLLLLAKNPERAYTREEILEFVWGKQGEVYDRAVDVHVCSLRKKLGAYSGTIKSVHGVGYKFAGEKAQLTPSKEPKN